MKIVCVAGARPNFMKIAPLMHAIEAAPEVHAELVHTGQHYDAAMSSVFFEQLGIPEPAVNLGIGGGTRQAQIEQIMAKFEPWLNTAEADAVLVVGDVNSTVACSRIAKKLGITTVHVEAGLRSFDMDMPEEVNRIETDQQSDLLFVTEQSGMDNLQREAVPGKAFLVGNVMIDTLARQLAQIEPTAALAELRLKPSEYMVGTFHRPSNVDTPAALGNVLEIIEHVAESIAIVLPLHPRTRNSLEANSWLERLTSNPNVHVAAPMPYVEFVSLVSQARGIVTDSGGVQEETTYLQVPCITMRDNTERPVTVELGTNVLAKTSVAGVRHHIDELLAGRHKQGTIPPLWDGQAAIRIVDLIKAELSAQ